MSENIEKLREAISRRLRVRTGLTTAVEFDEASLGLQDALAAVEQEMAELRKDAERWRYFHRRFYMDRHHDTMLDESGRLSVAIPVSALIGERCLSPSDVDIAVDNAIELEKATKQVTA